MCDTTINSDLCLIKLNTLLNVVKQTYGFDFSDYSQASIQRRINRILLLNKLSIETLQEKIVSDKAFFTYFLDELMVNITDFFRDPYVFHTLKEKILPQLSSYPVIRIWHAGCATGEEVYSMAILLKEAGMLHKSIIYASDISKRTLNFAKSGKYPVSQIATSNANYIHAGGSYALTDYFTIQNDEAFIHSEIKQQEVFSLHNLESDSSFNEFNLICCRNVMIYFNCTLQNKVHSLLFNSLTKFGFLLLGNKETIDFSSHATMYTTIDKKARIYRR